MNRDFEIRGWFLRRLMFALSAALVVGIPCSLFADEEAAKKLLETTQTLVEEAESDSAAVRLGKLTVIRKNFKLIDVELSDVEGTPKTEIEKAVKALKTRTDKLASSGETNDAATAVNEALTAAKESLDYPDSLERHLKEAESNLKKPEVRKALGDAKIASITKQIAALRKASVDQQHDRGIEQLKESIERLEESWPDTLKAIESDSESDRDTAIRSFQGRDYQLIEKILIWMPANDSEAKPLIARFKKLSVPFAQAVAKVNGGEAAEALQRSWESYLSEFEGWEKETAPPKFAQMLKEQSEAMSSLGAPKTVALASRTTAWLKSAVEENEDLKPSLIDPRVKSIVDQVTGLRNVAHLKLATFADKILKEAEAAKLDQSARDRLERFADDDLRLALEGSSKLEGLQARSKALVVKFDKAAGGSAAEKEQRHEELVKKAQADWPAMLQKYSLTDGFDPTKAAAWKGKVVHFANVRNRLGWDFKTNDYDFAVEINGYPVAGRFAPAVQEAVDKALAETGKDALPEEEYDVVAVVDGQCKVERRINSEGTGKVEGTSETVKFEAEGWKPEDAVLVNIVGLRSGPVAVAVDASSPAAAPGGGSSSGGGAGSSGGGIGWWFYYIIGSRFFVLVVGLFAASLALIKAGFPQLVSLPQVQQLRAKLGDENLGKIGILLAVWGLFGMINGWFFNGILISGSLFAAGAFAGIDVLQSLGVVKPEWAEKVRPYGTIIGLACAGAAILQLITGGMLRII